MFHIIKKHDSLAKRVILLAFTTISLSVLVTGSVIVWNFQKSQERNLGTYLTAYIDIFIAATHLDPQKEVTISDSVDVFQKMPFYWQVTTDGRVLRQSALIAEPIDPDIFDEGLETLFIGEARTPITAAIKHVTFPGNKKVSYLFGVQSQTAAAFIKEEQNKFIGSLFLALIFLAFFLIITIAFALVRASTQPLKRITREIVDIHEGKKKSLNDDFPKEIRLLAKEINTLIEYNIAIVERYGTFAANLSHTLKTPLTIMNNESQTSSGKLALTVKNKTADMLQLIDRNLARANAVGANNVLTSNVDVVPLIQKILASFSKLYDKRADLINGQDPVLFKGNEADLYEILGNIIENGCKYSKSFVRVEVTATEGMLMICVEDDGPGIAENERDNVLAYGTRLDQAKPGSGIGLAVALDIIELYQGKLELGHSDLGGLKLLISLPFSR